MGEWYLLHAFASLKSFCTGIEILAKFGHSSPVCLGLDFFKGRFQSVFNDLQILIFAGLLTRSNMGGLLAVEDTPFLRVLNLICQAIRSNSVALPFWAQKISGLIISATYGRLKAKNANLLLNFSLTYPIKTIEFTWHTFDKFWWKQDLFESKIRARESKICKIN